MPKLHELLAVEGTLEKQANTTRTELMGTFEKKKHHFGEKHVTTFSLQEGIEPETKIESSLQTSVKKEIAWISEHLGKALNASYAIDEANTQARADVVTEDGEIILRGVPTTALLRLDHRLKELLALAQTIPTLDPAKGFELDTNFGPDVFRARDVKKPRTKKIQRPLTLAPATDKHPAQVQLISEDIDIGHTVEQEWSSMITTATKADIIARIEKLARAVKAARSRANEASVDVSLAKCADPILGYIFKPLGL